MPRTIKIGLIGAGRIGQFHAAQLKHFVAHADLEAIADPAANTAQTVANALKVPHYYTDPEDLLAQKEIEGVILASNAASHAALIVKAAEYGKHIFCEKPIALTLEDADAALTAVKKAGVILQIGFNRRFVSGFSAALAELSAGKLGKVYLSRSLTRDPLLRDPSIIPAWNIFFETLIHDFDIILQFHKGAQPVEVYALADALIRPEYKSKGLLDTAVVTIRFDNGSIAVAEANFQAVYGYDVRGEIFGSQGMLQMGHINENNCVRYAANGISIDTSRQDVDLLVDSYRAELSEFISCIDQHRLPRATGEDGRRALMLSLACIESVKKRQPIRLSVEPNESSAHALSTSVEG